MKVGDKVTITMEVAETLGDMVFLVCDGKKIRSRASGWMHVDDCKPVESYPVVTELKVGDLVELRGRNRYNGARGILTQRNPANGWFWFEACDPTNRHISGWREETWEDEECGTFRLVKVD